MSWTLQRHCGHYIFCVCESGSPNQLSKDWNYFCFTFLIGNLLGVATGFEIVQKIEDDSLIKAKEGKECYSKERKGDTQLEFLCLVVDSLTVYSYICVLAGSI